MLTVNVDSVLMLFYIVLCVGGNLQTKIKGKGKLYRVPK